MSEHTPGPWRASENYIYGDRPPKQIARCHDVEGTPFLANARLIAAAPDLLKMCKDARDALATLPVGYLGYGRDGELIWSLRDELIDKMTQAITKAEGEE
jgi:hypothetical protein